MCHVTTVHNTFRSRRSEGRHQTKVTKNMKGRQGDDYEGDFLTKLSCSVNGINIQ